MATHVRPETPVTSVMAAGHGQARNAATAAQVQELPERYAIHTVRAMPGSLASGADVGLLLQHALARLQIP